MRKKLYKTFTLLLMLCFLCCVSGCGTLESVCRYILSLPMTLFNAIVP